MQKQKLIALIQKANYLDEATKQTLLAKTETISNEKAEKLIDFFGKLEEKAKEMEKEKATLIAKLYHVFSEMNRYSKKRVRKEKLENNQKIESKKDEKEGEEILSKIQNS